jgi:hypothetical protein
MSFLLWPFLNYNWGRINLVAPAVVLFQAFDVSDSIADPVVWQQGRVLLWGTAHLVAELHLE